MAFYAFSATLTTSGTNYQLSATGIAPADITIRKSFREVHIQADPDNGAGRVLVGDSLISGTRFGKSLTTSSDADFRSSVMSSVSIDEIYLRPTANSLKINVILIE